MLCVAVLIGGTGSLRAADPAGTVHTPIGDITPDMLELTTMNRVGGGILAEPTYPGAKRSNLGRLIDLDYTYEKRIFANTIDGLGVYLYNENGLSFGPSIFYRGSRKTSDDPALRGLNNISHTAQGRFSASYDFNFFSLGAAVIRDLGGTSGTQYELRAQSALPLNSRFFLLPSFTATFNDGAFAREWYGVTAAESLTSGRVAYRPSAGFDSVTGTLVAAYRFDTNWIGYIRGEAKYLGDIPGHSPIVQQRWQPTIGIGISYLFK